MQAFAGVRGLSSALLIVLIATFASGCAAGGYSTGSLRSRLVHAGLKPAQAECVVDKMVDKFGDAGLNARTAPNAAEVNLERTLLHECGVVVNPPR